jgi:hypothetical protein
MGDVFRSNLFIFINNQCNGLKLGQKKKKKKKN